MDLKIQLIYLLTSIFLLKPSQSLLYPASSSLGLVASISVPVLELLPLRRLLTDWCFQMSYDLPHQLSSFYNIPIWPKKPKRAIRSSPMEDRDVNNWSFFEKYNTTSMQGRHPSDLSAGELYKSIEDLLVSYGYNETCLLRSVCELARHPFDEKFQNVLTDIILFILTPSLHEGFDPSEDLYRSSYEDAERSGFLGEDCASIYPDCASDLLTTLSEIIV